ncbi:MAG TPA: hypothetical protein VF624_06105 [Tepidisphaeraceae bacterium]|jgi:prepilin-type processing-associated H-X9-DG protein
MLQPIARGVACVIASLAVAVHAAPPVAVAPLVSEQTVFVAQIDLTQIDLPDAAEWLQATLQRNGLPDDLMQQMAMPMNASAARGQAYVDALRAAGVERAAVVLDIEADLPAVHLAIAMPMPKDVAAVRRAARPLGDVTVGDLFVLTLPGDASVKDRRPAARDDLLKPLAANPDAAAAFAGGITDELREAIDARPRDPQVRETWMATVRNARDIRSATGAIDTKGGAEGGKPHVVARVEFTTPAAAAKVLAGPDGGGNPGPARMNGAEVQAFRSIIEAMRPRVEGATISVDAKAEDIDRLVKAAIPALQQARLAANRVKSASNLRQLMLCAMLYANDNQGMPFGGLNDLQKYLGGPRGGNLSPVMTNPSRPELKANGYTYVHPGVDKISAIKNPSERLAIYEAGDFGDGVNVGFWDGHVEFITDKQQFQKMLDLAENPPQP